MSLATVYKRLLRAAKTIDDSSTAKLLCGKPTSLYSYELGRNLGIGTSSYSMFDQMVAIMNDGEYPPPTHSNVSSAVSLHSAIQNSFRSKSVPEPPSRHCRVMVLTESELLEFTATLEALAVIAKKQRNPMNTFSSDSLELSDHILSSRKQWVRSRKRIKNWIHPRKRKRSKPLLEYIPKPSQSIHCDDDPLFWKKSLLFQHPLQSMAGFHCGIDVDAKSEPHVLLGLYAQSDKIKTKLTRRNATESRIALIINGESTLMNVGDAIGSDSEIETSHGTQPLPDIFRDHQLFIGGDDTSTIEVVTSNPYCKGVGLMGNRLFWNPNLRIAEKMIESNLGSVDQFRFFRGVMSWDSDSMDNVFERNLYALVMAMDTATRVKTAKQIWSNQQDGEHTRSLWRSLLGNVENMESWIQIYHLINDGAVKKEVFDLMRDHKAKISQQVQQYKALQSPQNICAA